MTHRPAPQRAPASIRSVPYGYRWTPAGLEVDEAAARIVRSVFHLRAEGLTLAEIAALLSVVSPLIYELEWVRAKELREVLRRVRTTLLEYSSV